ncbi:MAG TPA: serine/threonine-protein kinase, partial [Methylomirabilota bacterium]
MEALEPTFGDGRYLIRRVLGRGTMGVVYEAEDAVLARTVAVKTIDLAFAPGEAIGSEFEQRFFTEARVAARLSHPGIVVCHDVGKDPASGKLFIVFEYLRGRTLAERAAEGPMDWRNALEVVVRVARAIHHAHEHGVVHRDLKPANIMLLDPGTGGASAGRAEAAVKIMDFGVARLESLGHRLTRTGQSFGSPLYMSPEQALGQASTARSDIFSLGSVLCTLLLGRPWFDAPSLPEIVARVVHDDPPRLSSLRPDVPASLDAVVTMALAKREEDRYATAADLADDLEDVLAGRAAKRAVRAAPSSSHDPLASLLDEAPVPAVAPTAR